MEIYMHDGHRERLKQRFTEEGINAFSDHNVLELLLFYAIPRRDTNETAHRLINTFGSISGVFDASVVDIAKVEGVGLHCATLIKLVPSVMKKYFQDRERTERILDTTEKIGNHVLSSFMDRRDEAFILVCLDSKKKVLNTSVITEGIVNSINIEVRKILEVALRYNASAVILSHNHPSGIALPSNEDINTTIKIKNLLSNVNIILVDHIIVADRDYISFRDSGLLDDN